MALYDGEHSGEPDAEPDGGRRCDVLVIGGGAAGLSGALTLVRARRSVLVVDAGAPRNAPASHVHAYLGREGTPPGELLERGRAEVEGYGGEIVRGTVVAVERTGEGGFRAELADGTAVTAARLLVTTGLVDELPEVPGVAERWGRDVLHCPYCHGWEARDLPLGVLAAGPMAVHQALLWRQWSEDVTLFLHTAPEPTDDEYEQLAARGIAVVDGKVTGLELAGDRLSGVHLADGPVIPVRALVVAPVFTARGGVLAALGLRATPQEVNGRVIGSYLATDPTGATDVPGVWAAGNVTHLTDQVIGAAATAARAGGAINADLIAEETRRAVAARRSQASPAPDTEPMLTTTSTTEEHPMTAAQHPEATEAAADTCPTADARPDDAETYGAEYWDERYRQSDRLWSGEPNTVFVREVSRLKPGRALDLGCGEGADAVWLARHGWRVTATDISAVALDRAAGHAEEAGVADRVDWQRHDLGVSFPAGVYDLVSAQFLHSLGEMPREEILRTAAAAVAPGGVLLVVGHSGLPHWEGDQHPDVHLPTPDENLAALELAEGAWEVLLSDEHERTQRGPDGTVHTRTDNALLVRRRTDG